MPETTASGVGAAPRPVRPGEDRPLRPGEERGPVPPPPNQNGTPRANTTGDTVTVACKMPNGLVMQLWHKHIHKRHINGVVVEEMEAMPVIGAPVITLNGYSVDLGKLSVGEMPEHEIHAGHGLTYGVPRDFFDQWAHDNPELIEKRIVFAQSNEQNARAQAREQKGVKSGFEPIDQDKPGERIPQFGRLIQRGSRREDG